MDSDEKQLNRIFKLVANNAYDGYVYQDIHNDIFKVSDRLIYLFDLEEEKAKNATNLADLLDGAVDYEDILAFIRRLRLARESVERYFEYSIYSECNNRWVDVVVNMFYESTNDLREVIMYFSDVTNAVEDKSALEYQAYYDSLTGLYNRSYFYNILDGWMKLAKEKDDKIYIMYLDVDDFKKVNDELGFEYGDELMIKVSHFLKKFTSSSLSISRINSDEFIFAQYGGELEYIKDIYSDIRAFFDASIKLDNGIREYLTVSAGVCVYPNDGLRIVDLIGNADIALKTAKTTGKNCIRFFEKDMLNKFLRDIRIESLLKKAVKNENFELYYQPQFYAKDKTIRGFEALIRWNEESEGYISPGSFIPLAEKNGSIIEIGNWVLNKAFSDYANVFIAHGFDGIMSINISPLQFKDALFENCVINLLRQYHINPSKIEFEITESVFLEDSARTIELINHFRKLGIKISIDDFGTGYSSLAYLRTVPVDTLKIDKTFIDSVTLEENINIITTGIIDIVRKLGYEIIAEGVETNEQLEFLRSIHCDNIQGYLLGHPMAIRNAVEVVDKQRNSNG